jgi:hypothetical protein
MSRSPYGRSGLLMVVLRRFVIRVYRQAPANYTLGYAVLVVILRRERLILVGCDLLATSEAAIYAREWSCLAG